MRDGQAGHQKETRKEFAGGSTECSDSGRGEACGKTEKPGKVGSAHAHELFQSWQKKAVPFDSGQDTMPRDSCGSRRGECRVIKSGGAESSAAQKRSRVPIKSALKKRKMEAEKESITTMPHPAARQIFARLESFLARYDATKRESTVCMPPAPRRASVRRVVWRAGRYQRLPHRSGATGIFYRNPRILQMIPDAVRISVPRRSVFFLVIFSMG